MDIKDIKDIEVRDLILREEERQQNEICLIASENLPSPSVMRACGSIFMAKYSEGYPAKRYYGGCEVVDELENLAKDRACKLFGADHANVQSPSGSHANQCAYAALLNIGDTILASSLNSGGHLTHSAPVSFVSKLYNVKTYDVDPNTFEYNYDEIEKIAEEVKPKAIMVGTSAYSRQPDYKRFREIADKVGAYLYADMAHIAGLVAAGLHPSPIPYADIVTTTTHKTLRGARGGLILCKKEHAKAVDKAVFPQNAGGALQNMIAGKAICFAEAMTDEFKEYQAQVLKNAECLANCLMEHGVKLLTNGTNTHLMLLDLRDTGITGVELEKALEDIGIATNKNAVPFDTVSPRITSGLRIGTPSVTTRGMKEAEMIEIGNVICAVIDELKAHGGLSETMIEILRAGIKALTDRFPIQIH